MPSAIEVRFKVGGINEIHRAFKTVQDEADRAERRTVRQRDNEARATAKAERDKLREQQRTEREVARIRERGYRENARIGAEEIKAEKKKADEKLREEERWQRQRQRIQERSAQMAFRMAEKEVQDTERAERQKQRIREKHARAIGGAASRSIGGLARGGVMLAGGALALGGGFGIADAVQEKFALERQAALFSNMSSSMPGGRVSTASVMANARAAGLATNTDPAQVAAAMGAYFAKASDAGGAMKNADLFAQLSLASGTDITQVATAAGALKVQNPHLDDKAMRNMLLGLVGQTRQGAVDIAALAQYVPTITSTSALYGGDQALNQRKLIGLSQVAMRTSGSSAEAASSVQRFGSDIAANAGKIMGATGFNVKDKSGALKDPAEVIAALMSASGGDIGKLKHMGIGRESMKIFEAEADTFRSSGGGKKGAAAVAADISKFTEGGYDEKSLGADVANALGTDQARFAKITAKLTDDMEERLTPFLEKLADSLEQHEPDIEKFLDGIASFVEWLVANPFEGLGAIVATKVSADITKAAIGEATKAAFAKAVEAAGAKGINLPGALSIAAAGAVAIAAEKAWIEESTKEDHDKQVASAQLLPKAAGVVANLKNNPTQENIAKAKALMAQIQAAEGSVGSKTAFGNIASWFQGSDESKKEAAENERKIKNLMDSFNKLDAAIKKASTTADSATFGSKANPSDPTRKDPISARTGVPGTQ